MIKSITDTEWSLANELEFDVKALLANHCILQGKDFIKTKYEIIEILVKCQDIREEIKLGGRSMEEEDVKLAMTHANPTKSQKNSSSTLKHQPKTETQVSARLLRKIEKIETQPNELIQNREHQDMMIEEYDQSFGKKPIRDIRSKTQFIVELGKKRQQITHSYQKSLIICIEMEDSLTLASM